MKTGKIFGYTLFAGLASLPLFLTIYFDSGIFYLPLFLALLFGTVAAVHFIQYLDVPLEYRYSSNPYPLYVGPLFWGIGAILFCLLAGWYWIFPFIILTAAQLWFWQKYPFLPRKFRSPRQWVEPVAKAAGAMAFGILAWVLLIAVLNVWHLGGLSPTQWVAMMVLFLLSIPMSMTLAMLPLTRRQVKINPPIRKGTSLADQIKYLDWQNIPIAHNILQRTQSESGYHLLPSYSLALSRFPRAWYPFSKKELEAIQDLEDLIQTKMDDLIEENAQFQSQPRQCWCQRHYCRAANEKYGEFTVTICRICKTDKHLIYPVSQAIGVIGNGKPAEEGESVWLFPTWDETTNTFVPGDYDEIRMETGTAIPPDWYVTAMVAWLDNHYAVTKKAIPITIQRGMMLGENARKLLEVAESEGKILVKWMA